MADPRVIRVLDSLESRLSSLEELGAQTVENETQLREGLHVANGHIHGIKSLLIDIRDSVDQLKKDANADDRAIRQLQQAVGSLVDTLREYHSGGAAKFAQLEARVTYLEGK